MASKVVWAGSRLVSSLVVLSACSSPPPASPHGEPIAPPAAKSAPDPTPASSSIPPANGAPVTRVAPVTDEYHGVSVTDDYRWLEDASSPEVKAWSLAENAYTRAKLDAIPNRSAVAARVSEVLRGGGVRYAVLETGGKRWFVLVDEPPKQQRFVITVRSGGTPKEAKTLVDPNILDPSGKTAIDWFRPSPDGKLLAVSLSKAGSELGEVSVYDVETGKVLADVVPRVNGGTAGGDLAWAKDGKGFYYTRYPAPGERAPEDLSFYQQVHFHELGTPTASDRYELGKEFPRIAENRLGADPRTGRVLATTARGDGGEFSHALRSDKGAWKKLTDFEDAVVELAFDPASDDLWAISRKNTPRGALLRVDGKTLDVASAKVVVPEQTDTLVSDFQYGGTLLPTRDRVFALYQQGGPSTIRAFGKSGNAEKLHPPLEVASFGGLVSDGPSVLFVAETFLAAPTWYRLDPKTGEGRPTAFVSEVKVPVADYGALREAARSKDGTSVPFTVLTPKDFHADGSRACVVTGYGGYGIDIVPRYRPDTVLWLERGVVHVVANLRGGGEFGEAWHRAGNLLNKQNVFDDFAAVLVAVGEKKICDPRRIGIIGGSNGGLLMGATLTQHPELVRAAVSFVGLYDMLRVELAPNGAFNVTEFGTVKEDAQFRALRAYSPYHHVNAGTLYPPTLFITGENDPRVDPLHSRKMTALLQAKTAGGGPILLRTSSAAGHGMQNDLAESIAQKTDAFSFMLDALGVEVAPPAR